MTLVTFQKTRYNEHMSGDIRSLLVVILTVVLLILNSNGWIKIPAEALTLISTVLLGSDGIVRASKSMALGKIPLESPVYAATLRGSGDDVIASSAVENSVLERNQAEVEKTRDLIKRM